MFKWPMLSTVFGVVANFFFLSIIAIFSWFAYVLRSNDEFVSQSAKVRLSGEIPSGENDKVVPKFATSHLPNVGFKDLWLKDEDLRVTDKDLRLKDNDLRFKDKDLRSKNNDLRFKDKDLPRGQQHWVTVKNGLLADIYQ